MGLDGHVEDYVLDLLRELVEVLEGLGLLGVGWGALLGDDIGLERLVELAVSPRLEAAIDFGVAEFDEVCQNGG